MQDRYVSLNPSNVDSIDANQRSQLFNRRLHESQGGEVADVLANQLGLTASVFAYAQFRKSGFRLSPYQVNKTGRYGAIVVSFLLARQFGYHYATQRLGDQQYFEYLSGNRKAILAGTASLDQ